MILRQPESNNYYLKLKNQILMSDKKGGNQVMSGPTKVRVTAKDFAAKYKSKWEVYNLLTVDCGIYLPKYGTKLAGYP